MSGHRVDPCCCGGYLLVALSDSLVFIRQPASKTDLAQSR